MEDNSNQESRSSDSCLRVSISMSILVIFFFIPRVTKCLLLLRTVLLHLFCPRIIMKHPFSHSKEKGSGNLKLHDESSSGHVFFIYCLSHLLECQIQTAGTWGVLFNVLLSVP